MPAAESRIKDAGSIERLGVIAGGGALPSRLLHVCDRRGIEAFVVGFEGQTDPAIVKGHNHLWTRLGAAGLIINTLKSHGVRDLVLIGAICRPTLAELRPDLRTAAFFARVGLQALGDDGLLGALRRELEQEGFRVHGVHAFAADLLAGEGPVGALKPKKEDRASIARGIAVARSLGVLDIGQSVVVQDGIILGVEAAEGTDELIRRCGALKRKGRGPILVKACKPGQDRDLDLPTIGPETVRRCAEAGFSGIVIHAGHSLILDPQDVADLANKNNLFVAGIDIESYE